MKQSRGLGIRHVATSLTALAMAAGCRTPSPPSSVPPPEPTEHVGKVASPTPRTQLEMAEEAASQRPTQGAPAPPPRVHSIEPGDTLWEIARRYRVRLADLQTLNPGVDPRRLKVGRQIILPHEALEKTVPASRQAKASANGWYTVQPGDTLSAIARANRTTVQALREANQLSGDMIRVGVKLRIPTGPGGTGQSVSAPQRAGPPVSGSLQGAPPAPSPLPPLAEEPSRPVEEPISPPEEPAEPLAP